ncbi:unnamed protein product [Rotaria sp. Silwood2]|nr:unnamed protein product [Rotaria sp. Silwood2]CAF3156404.1 unnamed protein product [Rotaria sp. Silwood2]CAF3323687.1 unnamed protein product [Rotaria sp. Silwood2]CAF3446912.1 unnamed protein product [Rotaria sp. Silwood2]
MRTYVLQSPIMMGRWMITIASVDRFAMSSRNARIRHFAQTHVARRAILIIIVVWLILPIHTLIFFDIREGAGVCAIIYNRTAALYHSLYTFITGGFLPSIIMITSAVLIRRNLASKRDIREQQVNASNPASQLTSNSRVQRTRDQNALAMLFIQIIVYCVVQTPQFVYILYGAIASNVPNKSPDRLAIEKFFFFFAELCVFLFPVTPFYFYIVVSRTFRNELCNIVNTLLKVCFGRRNVRVEPIRNTTNSGTKRREMCMISQAITHPPQGVNPQRNELPNILPAVPIE